MVSEALAAIDEPFQVETLSITNGNLTYSERMVVGAWLRACSYVRSRQPFPWMASPTAGKHSAAIQLRAQGDFADRMPACSRC